MSKRVRGFTLLELLVVIVLLIMMVGVTTISIVSGQDSAMMKTNARQLLSTLRSIRTQAVTEGIETAIIVDREFMDGNAVGRDTVNRDAADWENKENNKSYTILPADEEILLSGDLTLTLIPFAGYETVSPGSLWFYPDGSSSGGNLVLRSSAGKMVISVNWLTGEAILD
ncbi:MAG: hypothetical protein DRR06_07185 [Gammaproteobacteria bacterium]|nr:MAG: hypothetical protein DRR06_07185 [Gammaproteobacteria bacterium]RLA51458.1 MAG: hypothetical protein DRR42_10345 [Gammaproteobacteria bacterium]